MSGAPTEHLHRYSVGGVLGQGGMAVVYAAFDAQRGRDVALKRLTHASLPAQQSERVTALFEREYHTLSQLEHPHIIEVYDYGLDEQGPYYTMERLSGHSARARRTAARSSRTTCSPNATACAASPASRCSRSITKATRWLPTTG